MEYEKNIFWQVSLRLPQLYFRGWRVQIQQVMINYSWKVFNLETAAQHLQTQYIHSVLFHLSSISSLIMVKTTMQQNVSCLEGFSSYWEAVWRIGWVGLSKLVYCFHPTLHRRHLFRNICVYYPTKVRLNYFPFDISSEKNTKRPRLGCSAADGNILTTLHQTQQETLRFHLPRRSCFSTAHNNGAMKHIKRLKAAKHLADTINNETYARW